jgi:hypothetical protein
MMGAMYNISLIKIVTMNPPCIVNYSYKNLFEKGDTSILDI